MQFTRKSIRKKSSAKGADGGRRPIEALEARRLLAAAIDTIVFGNTTSETAHAFTSNSTQVITGGLSQSARQLLPLSTVGVNGGDMTFTMTVDPSYRNYFSVKFWANDDTDQGKGRLYLYVPINGVTYQVGYRHEGDYTPLNQAAAASPLPNRFFYSTTLLPLWMTQGKSSLTMKIQSTGELYGLGSGGPPTGNYQMNMDTASRGVYRVYTHTQPMLDVSGETQGTAPTVTTRPSVSDTSVLGTSGTYTLGLKNWVIGKLSAAVSTFTTSDVQLIANSYSVTQFGWTATQKTNIINTVIAAIDGFTSDYYTNPSTSVQGTSGYGGAGGNEVWGGRFGPLGWAIHLLSSVTAFTSQLDTSASFGTVGGTRVRRAAWGDMLFESRDYGRYNRRTLTNQTILANINIYKANRALSDLGNASAFTETAAKRYLKESVGILPWLGDDLPGGGSELLYGSSYYQTTLDGLTREWGYAGGYSEMAIYAANFYRWTGDVEFKTQAIKMVKASANMRRPAIETSGANFYRSMERIGILAWRGVREADGYFKNDISYANQASWSAGMIVAGVTLDPYAIGYAKQMLADNQYLFNLTSDPRYYASPTFDALNAMDVFTDYFAVKNATDSGIRLPMTSGQADYAWADEQDGVVAIKQGENRLWIESYWQAKTGTGVNGVGRFEYSTPTYEQFGDIETTPNYTFNGEYFVRPNNVDTPEQTLYAPPDNPTQAYAGEMLPIVTARDDSRNDTPYRGKADFWAMRFGPYLIGINEHSTNSYVLKTPNGFTSATDLITNSSRSGTINVGANATVVLNLPSATDAAPRPNAPLLVTAQGSSTQVVLNWTAASGATTYSVKRANSSNGPFTNIATNLSGTTYTDTNVTQAQAYYYVVSATNTNGESYNSSVSPTSAGQPVGWASQDIGSVALPGSSSTIGSSIIVRGSGTDVGGGSDSFHYDYVRMTGDGVIIARLANYGYTNGSDKAGLMMRDSMNTGSVAASLVFEDQFNQARLASRTSLFGGTTYSSAVTPVGAPYWLKLARVGNTYTGYVSPDGATWTTVSSATFTMPSTINVGLFVVSRYTQQISVMQFDNVQVNQNTLSGTSGADTIRLVHTSTNLLAYVNDMTNPAFSMPLATQGSLSIDALGSSDILEVVGNSSAGSTTFSTNAISFEGIALTYSNTEAVRYDGKLGRDSVTVNSGLPVIFAASQSLASLVIANNANVQVQTGGQFVLDTNLLNLNSSGQLDLNDNLMIVRSAGTLPAIISKIQAGQNGFDANGIIKWNGRGIMSSVARSANLAAGVDATTVSAIRNGDLDDLFGTGSSYTLFKGVAVSAEDVLVRFSYSGDANLDGEVSIDDYNAIDAAYLNLIPTRGLASGDFDANGTIDIDDYNMIDIGYLYQGLPLGV